MPNLLRVDDLGRAGIERILATASRLRSGDRPHRSLSRIGLLFYEDSLRTRVGFEVAADWLGASSSVVLAPKQAATMRIPETVEDAVRSIEGWFDALVVRHSDTEGVGRAAEAASTPVINAGDGTGEHPTQALIDLFAISESQGTLDGLTVGLVGDLRGMRTAHSLAHALAHAGAGCVRAMAPPGLELPSCCGGALERGGWTVERSGRLDLAGLDVVYVAGLPAETSVGVLSQEEQEAFRITPERAGELPTGAVVLCPLPRVDEIERGVDTMPVAGYFAQSRDALWVRAAVLLHVTAA